jgi:phospho-N-acetylmuramoyl-pentapeptide-transferase
MSGIISINWQPFWLAFGLSVVLVWLQILWSKRKHLGQSIREEGPKHHHIKSGTPTMGGIAFILAAGVALLFLPSLHTHHNLALFFLVFTLALVGGLDDWLILKRGKNQGLYGRQKLLGQILCGIVFGVVAIANGHHLTVGTFLQSIGLGFPLPYFLFVVFMIVSASNAVNLTDGLDGLATGLSLIALSVFAVILFQKGLMDLLALDLVFMGTLLAFLIFNKNPAQIFMGDVGSLALGGLLAGFAILSHKELIFIVIGGVFVIETLSVMLQVFTFQTFGFRIFKMSPLHHHFELSGWHETKVVYVFWALGIVFGLIGLWLY